jgi:hypothetical protein
MALTDYAYWNFLDPSNQAVLRSRYGSDADVENFLKADQAANQKFNPTYGQDTSTWSQATTAPTTGGTPGAPGAPAGAPPAGTPGAPGTTGGGPNVPGTVPSTGNALLDALLGKTTSLVDYFSGLKDQSTGLSPATLAALKTQAIDTVPGRFDQASRDLATKLRRDNPGGLPQGGELLRNYAPLASARESTRAGLLRDVVMANEAEKIRTGDLNKANALTTLTSANNLFGQVLGSDTQKWVAGLNSDTQKWLGTLSADTQKWIAGADNDTKRWIAGLDTDAQKWIAGLNSDTQKWLGGLSSDTQRFLGNLDATTRTNLGNLDADTRLAIAKLDNAPSSVKNLLLGSLLSTLAAPGANGKPSILGTAINAGIDGLTKIFKGGGTAADAAAAGAAAGGGSLGSTITGFLTNPVTIGVGAALAAGAMWLKSQAHWEANTMVKDFENPFHYDYLAPFVTEFNKTLQSGQMSKQQAQDMRNAFVSNWDEYVTKARQFGTKGSDEKTVSDQSIMNLWNVAIQPILNTIDGAINVLA